MRSQLFSALAVFASVSCAPNHVNDRRAESAPVSAPQSSASSTDASAGRTLFLKNCAHCHGADARGDEGPDLHHLDWTDEQIALRIRNGKKGQMTAFASKFSEQDIKEVIAYLRKLN